MGAFSVVAMLFMVFVASDGLTMELIRCNTKACPFFDPEKNETDGLVQKAMTRYSFQKGAAEIGAQAPININGALLMSFTFGTPAQKTYAIPDTGSSLVWLQCAPCISRYPQHRRIPIYDSKKSSTFSTVACRSSTWVSVPGMTCNPSNICSYQITYVDKSESTGVIANEIFTFNGEGKDDRNVPIVFGCGTNNTMTGGSNAPGVVGLRNYGHSLIKKLGVSSFSYCVGDTRGMIRFGSSSLLLGNATPMFTCIFGNYHVICLTIM